MGLLCWIRYAAMSLVYNGPCWTGSEAYELHKNASFYLFVGKSDSRKKKKKL